MWRLVMAVFMIQALGAECILQDIDRTANPEVAMNVSQIILHWQYPVEEYEVETEDSYILTLVRIPYGRMGNNISGFLAFSTLPKMAQEVKAFFALAPVFYVQHSKSLPFVLLFQLPRPLLKLLLGDKDFLPETTLNKVLATEVCNNEIIGVVCVQAIFSVSGFGPENLNMSRIDIYVAHSLAGTSVQNILHYYQSYHEILPILQAYDWGSPEENLAHYNQMIPPTYNLSAMKVPTALWSGLRDLLADPIDVSNLVPEIPNMMYHKIIPTYDHFAFVFGITAPQTIYYEIIKMIKESQ